MSTKQNTSTRLFDQTDWTPDDKPAPQTLWQGEKSLTREQKEAGFVKAFIAGSFEKSLKLARNKVDRLNKERVNNV